jgi:hypothetical protein
MIFQRGVAKDISFQKAPTARNQLFQPLVIHVS